MEIILTDIEERILGSLIEKSQSTPEYYPLSLNALSNACNQKSSREPVTAYSESEIERAAADMIKKGLAHLSQVGRVPKYEELFTRSRQFVSAESAIMCVLLLRGAQTLGEIRTRTGRMHNFSSLEEVQTTIADLEELGLVRRLERRAGHKEARYSHLLKGQAALPAEPIPDNDGTSAESELEQLEQRVAALEDMVAGLRDAFHDFKKQNE
jgi:hypothetical protein